MTETCITYASEFAHDMCMILGNAFLHLNISYRHMARYMFLASELLNGRACAVVHSTILLRK